MKKFISILLTILMLLSLAACGENEAPPSGGNTTPPTDPPSENNTPDTPTPTPTTTTPPEANGGGAELGGDMNPTAPAINTEGTIQFGGYDWQVLEERGTQMLIISNLVLEINKPVHNDPNEERTWATCDLRAYLNGEFYNSFSADDRARIVQTTNKTPDNPWFGTDGGADTNDYIFLLSLEEVVKYYGDSELLENRPLNSAGNPSYDIDNYANNHLRAAQGADGREEGWWLRSAGHSGYVNAYVHAKGKIDVSGAAYDGGVRPAMWITLP